MGYFLIVLPFLVVLTGCGSADKPPLIGKREQIVAGVTAFEPDPELIGIEMNLPSAVKSAQRPQANGAANNHAPHQLLPERVTEAWRKEVMGHVSRDESLVNPPVVADGKVFLVTPKSQVVALDAWSGDILWRKDLYSKDDKPQGLQISGGVAFEKGVLFVTTSSGHVFSLDTVAGDVLWQQSVGASVRAAPTVAGGRIFVVSHDNRLHVISVKNGQLLWNHSGIEEPLALLGGAAPAVANGVVVVAYSSGEIYALSAVNGRYLWHEALSAFAAHDPLTNITDILAAPVIVDKVIYVANMSGQMAALSLDKGQVLWRRDYSARGTPVVAGNGVFILTNSNQMLGLHRKSGRVKWVMDLGKKSLEDRKKAVSWFGPVFAGGRLIALSSDGYAVSVSPHNGEKVSLIKLINKASVPPVVANEILYFLGDDGRLFAYD